MSGQTPWREVRGAWFEETPESLAAYREAKRELDESWEVTCRYGNCVCFVHPVKGDIGGWGAVDCYCERPRWRWVERNWDKPHRCPECHAVATRARWPRSYGPRTVLKCPTGCKVMWRVGSRHTRQTEQHLKRANQQERIYQSMADRRAFEKLMEDD